MHIGGQDASANNVNVDATAVPSCSNKSEKEENNYAAKGITCGHYPLVAKSTPEAHEECLLNVFTFLLVRKDI